MTNPIAHMLAPMTSTRRQAITTKFLGPTNHHGSRIKATCEAGSLYFECDDALDIDDNHAMAAAMLASRYGWLGHAYIGTLSTLAIPAAFAKSYAMGGTHQGFTCVAMAVRADVSVSV